MRGLAFALLCRFVVCSSSLPSSLFEPVATVDAVHPAIAIGLVLLHSEYKKMNQKPPGPIAAKGQGRRVRLAVPLDLEVADRQQYSVDSERPAALPAHHLRRRRSAVVGLSPNSSLSIGAVM